MRIIEATIVEVDAEGHNETQQSTFEQTLGAVQRLQTLTGVRHHDARSRCFPGLTHPPQASKGVAVRVGVSELLQCGAQPRLGVPVALPSPEPGHGRMMAHLRRCYSAGARSVLPTSDSLVLQPVLYVVRHGLTGIAVAVIDGVCPHLVRIDALGKDAHVRYSELRRRS